MGSNNDIIRIIEKQKYNEKDLENLKLRVKSLEKYNTEIALLTSNMDKLNFSIETLTRRINEIENNEQLELKTENKMNKEKKAQLIMTGLNTVLIAVIGVILAKIGLA